MSENITILCVEDEIEIRENISEILRYEGFTVFEAENGAVGFNMFLEKKPDLIISDIMMPELDGYGLLSMVRKSNNRNNNVPFIFLTARGTKDDMIKGISMSANDYLIKPVDFDLLIAKVREKAINSLKIQENQAQDINNIKNQIVTIMPAQTMQNLDEMINIIHNLRNEPYGPLPHRRYLEDINRLYLGFNKIKASILNSFDSEIIDNRLNVEDDIFPIYDFFRNFIAKLPVNQQEKIKINKEYIDENLPMVKLNKAGFSNGLSIIFDLLFEKFDGCDVEITFMVDHFDKMAIIFYLKNLADDCDIEHEFSNKNIESIFEEYHCSLKFGNQQHKSIVLFVPDYRLIEKN